MGAKLVGWVWLLVLALVVSAVNSDKDGGGTGLPWTSFFRASQFFNSSTSHLQEYARQKLSTLRYLRNKLTEQDQAPKVATTAATTTTTIAPISVTNLTTLQPMAALKREEAFGSILKNVDTLLAFTTGPLRKMVTSKQGIESLASMMMPKRDVLQKLLEIKGHLEPSLKRYLTDKYNGFLSSLIPYSENIGVPPFVLNSMKIPQDFDPRWQLIESLLKSQGGVEKFLHKMVNGDFKVGKMPEVIESRSGDETELISDQEPDASGKGYRKQQHFYLSSFKKRLMKPSTGGKVRLVQQNGALRPGSVMDYDGLMDQSGQYGHVSYDTRLPDDMMMTQAMYQNGDENTMLSDMDLAMAASGGRGHGYGGGHGHGHGQASYGGFLDPFTILGGLAFLTYLGLMLQNSLNRNGTAMPMGRSYMYNTEGLLPVVPISLKAPRAKLQLSNEPYHHQRRGRSLALSPNPNTPAPVTIDQVLSDIEILWKEIEKLNEPSLSNQVDQNCTRFRQCKIVWKMRVMNLEPVFASKLINSTDDLMFLNYVMTGKLQNLCEPYRSKNCE